MTTVTDNQQKFIDSMKEHAADGCTFKDAILAIVKEVDDVKKIPDAIAAIETLQSEKDSGSNELLTRMGRVERRVASAHGYRGHLGNEELAHGCGLHIISLASTDANIRQRAADALKSEHKDIYERAQTAGAIAGGAALIATEYQTGLERAEFEHGVVKQRLKRKTMNTDSHVATIRTGRPKVYIWGEGSTPTESEMKLAQVKLQVQNWATLAFFPVTLSEDSAVNIAEELFDWFGEGFGYQFDFVTLVGDGGEDSFGKRGVIPKWLQLDKTSIQYDAAVAAYADLTEEHFLGMMAKTTNASRANGRWYCSSTFFFTVMVPIQLSKGGVPYAEMRGEIIPQFLGKPVEFAEVIDQDALYKDKTDTEFRAPCAFGDLGRAGAWGDRKEVGFMRNDNVKWLEGQVAVMGVQRTDVNFYDGVETEEGKSAMSVLKVDAP